MKRAGARARREGPRPDAALLVESLEALAGREADLSARFYDVFFARHPEVVPLFGEHGQNEREEMLRETLASVLAHAEGQPWLDENLRAMGRSHAEYGVEDRHYPQFVAALLDTLDEVMGSDWSPETSAAWRRALERLTRVMRRAGAGPE